ncbi:hypothetical protein MKEN_00299400 [Mycena kentingensis (nom. inval.)]|nr:hypothetical protein MKEN_00299400 [Mycena kentingensis (nom. inval.)]
MVHLPDELLDAICLLLDPPETRNLLAVSTHLRAIALPHFVALYGLSLPTILQTHTLQIGTTPAATTIPVIASIATIRELVLCNVFDAARQRLHLLRMLADIRPSIPALVIQQSRHTNTLLVDDILQPLTTYTRDRAVVVLQATSMDVWRPPNPSAADSNGLFAMKIHRLLSIQIAANGAPLTIVYVSSQSREITLQPTPGISKENLALVARYLHVPAGERVMRLAIHSGMDLDYGDVVGLILRHQFLQDLSLYPASIRGTSLTTIPSSAHGRGSAGDLYQLTSPAMYVPSIVSIAPNLGSISVSFPAPAGTVFDIAAYRAAMHALAQLTTNIPRPADSPTSSGIQLTLTFPLAAEKSSLPWGQADSESEPESLLHLAHLTLHHTKTPRGPGPAPAPLYTEADVRLLAPWLARFPGLRKLSLYSVSPISAGIRADLEAAICAACRTAGGWRMRAEDVYLDVSGRGWWASRG